MKSILVSLSAISLLFLASCTTPPLTADEKVAFRNVQLVNEVTRPATYLKVGTTVFNNGSSKIPESDLLLKDFDTKLKKELKKRGYKVSKNSPRKLVVSPSVTGVAGNQRTWGPSALVHVAFGLKISTVGNSVSVRLIDEAGKPRLLRHAGHTESLKLSSSPTHWNNFTLNEKKQMVNIIKKANSEVVKRALEQIEK